MAGQPSTNPGIRRLSTLVAIAIAIGIAAHRRGAFDLGEMRGGVDERDVGEGLRKVAELASRARVVLLGKEADVVAQSEQPLEQRARRPGGRQS